MLESSETDEALVALSLTDTSYFATLVMRYEDKLGRYVSRLGVRNKEDQEDLLQDIFIKIYKNLNNFDQSLKFSSWAYRIAHNEAISWYRKKNVRPEGHLVQEADTLLELLKTPEADSELQFDQTVNATEVARGLEQLDDKYRSVLVLRFFEHKEYEEISDILKIPIGTVGTLVHRGKKQLRDKLHTESIRI